MKLPLPYGGIKDVSGPCLLRASLVAGVIQQGADVIHQRFLARFGRRGFWLWRFHEAVSTLGNVSIGGFMEFSIVSR
jgi:hypothetical protein